MSIKKATVLGAGVMGSQIAALLVNAGISVLLLDRVVDENDKNKNSKFAYDRITDRKKSQLYDPSFAANLSYGNYDDDLAKSSDSDLYIEAVAEILEVKHDIWSKVEKVAKPTAILATNTSGIPIETISEVLSDETRKRFIGLHFFNPPRFMKLVELITNTKTSQETIDAISDFSLNVLGKGLVPANDVSGFIANRIGTFTMEDIFNRAEEQGLSIPHVDALTGEYIGRPKLGTYKLADMVGTDIAYNVTKGMMANPEEAEYFKLSPVLEKLVQNGFLGDKVGKGFYAKQGKDRFVINPETLEYEPLVRPEIEFAKEFGRNPLKNLQVIFNSDNSDAKFMWETLRNVMHYSALNVPKASSDYKNIDRAMVWGYNWLLGPFQLWDAIGFEQVKERMRTELGQLPQWIEDRTEPFYAANETISYVAPVETLIEKDVWDKKGSTKLSVVNGDQLLLKMQTPANTITNDFSLDLVEAVKVLENENYSSLVLYSDGPNFCLGANLQNVKGIIEERKVDEEIPAQIDTLHNAVKAMRYATKPVITAVQGRALGGGAELVLNAPYVVAAAESYIGLVEVGVGLIPSGGGLAELTDRALRIQEESANRVARLIKLFEKVSMGFVSSNAYEAKSAGFLRDTDLIIQNDEQRVYAALDYAKTLSKYGYRPLAKTTYIAPGQDFKSIVEGRLESMRIGHFVSDYDMEVSLAVADVISGGELPRNVFINHDYLLQREKENFVKLSKNQKTYERIAYMLETKRPLRN